MIERPYKSQYRFFNFLCHAVPRQPYIIFRKGYRPQYLNLTGTLSADQSENVFTFQYLPVAAGEETTPAGGTEEETTGGGAAAAIAIIAGILAAKRRKNRS